MADLEIVSIIIPRQEALGKSDFVWVYSIDISENIVTIFLEFLLFYLLFRVG